MNICVLLCVCVCLGIFVQVRMCVSAGVCRRVTDEHLCVCVCAGPYPFADWDLVVVADAVFTQEVKLHHTGVSVQRVMEGDVLHAQRAAAHRVRPLTLLLLVTRSQSQLEGERTRTHTHTHAHTRT